MQDPGDYNWIGAAWALLLSMFGGLVKFLNKVKPGQTPLSIFIFQLIVQLFTSGFVGLVTWHICLEANISSQFSAVLIAIAGHMGTVALEAFEQSFTEWVKRVFNR